MSNLQDSGDHVDIRSGLLHLGAGMDPAPCAAYHKGGTS